MNQPSVPVHAVQVATGPRGERAHPALIGHGRTLERRVHRVTDRIHCQLGTSLGNATLVRGRTGNIVVDTGDCIQHAAEQWQDLSAVDARAVSALIYTHGHYALGSRHYVAPGDEERLPIYAHRDLLAVLGRTLGDLSPFLTRRVAIQFGMFLPPEGPDAMPNFGLGKVFFELDRYSPIPGFVRPNRLLDDGQEETIDGVRFQFWHAPADSEDTLLIWLPDDDTVINNIAWPTMFNIYSLRGESFRNPLQLLPGLDRILDLAPEHLVGVHGVPISGRQAVRQAVTEYRDCIQFTYDQTVRGINRGLTPDELVRFVQLPAALANGRLTGQFYGELPYHVRQIYTGLVGWFGSDTVELHPLAQADSAARWLELAGGTNRVLQEARAALEREDFAWATELVTAVRRAQPANDEARRLKAEALRAQGQRTTAANTRSWYLTHARELERELDTRQPPIRFVNATTVQQMPLLTYVRALRFRIDPALSEQATRTVLLQIGNDTFTLTLRHGVTVVTAGPPGPLAQPDARISMTLAQWAALVSGDLSSDAAAAAGVQTGGATDLVAAVLGAACATTTHSHAQLP